MWLYQNRVDQSRQFVDQAHQTVNSVNENTDKFGLENTITVVQEQLLDTLGVLELNQSIQSKINNVSSSVTTKEADLKQKLDDINAKIGAIGTPWTLENKKHILGIRIATLTTSILWLEMAYSTAETAYQTATATPPVPAPIITAYNNAKTTLQNVRSELASKETELRQVEADLTASKKIRDNLSQIVWGIEIGVYDRIKFFKNQYNNIKDETVKFNYSRKIGDMSFDPTVVGSVLYPFATYGWGALWTINSFVNVPIAWLKTYIYNQDGEKANSSDEVTGVQIEWESGAFTLTGVKINSHTGEIESKEPTLTDSSGNVYKKYPAKIKLQIWVEHNLSTNLIQTIPPRPLTLSNRKTINVKITPPDLSDAQRSAIYVSDVKGWADPRLESIYRSDWDLWYKKIKKAMMLEFLKEIHHKLYDSLTSEYQKDRFCDWFGKYISTLGVRWFECTPLQLKTQFQTIALKKTKKFVWSEDQYRHHLHTQVNTHMQDRYKDAIRAEIKSDDIYSPPNDQKIYEGLAEYEKLRMQDTIDSKALWGSIETDMENEKVAGTKKNRHRGNRVTRPARWISNVLRRNNRNNKLDKTKTAIDKTPWTSFFEGNTYKSKWSYMDKTHSKSQEYEIEVQFSIQSHSIIKIKTDGNDIELWATETIPQAINGILHDSRIPEKTRPHIALHIIKMMAQTWEEKCGPLAFNDYKITFDKEKNMKIEKKVGWTYDTVVDEKHLIDTGTQADFEDSIKSARCGVNAVMAGYNSNIYQSLTQSKNSRLTKKKIKWVFDFKVWPHNFVYKDGAITSMVNGTQRTFTDLEFLLCHNDFYGHQIEIIKTLNQKLLDEAFKRPNTKKYYYYAKDPVTDKTYVIFNDGKIGEYLWHTPPSGEKGKIETPIAGTRNEKKTVNYVLSNPKLMSLFMSMMKG